MEYLNLIIYNPSTPFYLQILIICICFIEFLIFWHKRNYSKGSGYLEVGIGQGSSSKSPQYTWAITIACWGLVELLKLWSPESNFFMTLKIVFCAILLSLSILSLLFDDEPDKHVNTRGMITIAALCLSVIFTISAFFHKDLNFANSWFIILIIVLIINIITRNYYQLQYRLIAVLFFMIAFSIYSMSFPEFAPIILTDTTTNLALVKLIYILTLILLPFPVLRLKYVKK